MSKGLFVVFEGGDGAGKTTQVDRLARALRQTVHPDAPNPVTVTREPGGTPLGGYLRTLLLTEQMPPKVEALLFLADRAMHVATVIRPALAAGQIVVSDRYVDSSLVYQGTARGLGGGRLMELSNWATDGLRPDLVIVLDIDPVVGLARARPPAGIGGDRIEREPTDFHQQVRRGFLDLAEGHSRHTRNRDIAASSAGTRYVVLDAGQPADLVAAEVASIVHELLTERRGLPCEDVCHPGHGACGGTTRWV